MIDQRGESPQKDDFKLTIEVTQNEEDANFIENALRQQNRLETARAHECTMMQLDTFNYQAPEFYKKLGFVQYGELKYQEGFVRHYFTKSLKSE